MITGSIERRPSGRHRVLSTAVLLGFVLAGCVKVGPNYEVPTATVEMEWMEREDPAINEQPPSDPAWWKGAFQDPVLDELIATALAENLSLRSAGLRVLQARQQLLIATGQRYPQQQVVSGSAATQQLSENATSHLGIDNHAFETYSLGFNLVWEADVWGKFRRMVEAASAQLDASVAGYDGVMVALIAEVAQSYLLVRTFQQRIEIATENVENQAESLRVARARFEAGAVSALDVEQADTLLNGTKASVATLEISLQQLKNALAVLLGKPPQEMSSALETIQPIPDLPPEVALGMPQDLLRRRPDIRVAERQLAAQSAEIGVAVAELYPSFSLGGTIGSSAKSLGGLFSGDGVSFNLFGAFQWNIFNYGRLKNNVRFQDAVFQQLLVDYRETVLEAQAETENAIVAYIKSQEQLASYDLAAAAAQRAVDLSTLQYQEGAVDFTSVLTSLQALVTQQDIAVVTRGATTTNLVQVYKALGGGWELRQSSNPNDLIPESTKEEMEGRGKYWKERLQTSDLQE